MPLAAANPGLARALDGIAIDSIEREHYADLLHNGAFRQSLLCRSERTPLGEPDLSLLDRFHAVTYLRPESPPVELAQGVPARFVSSGVATLETADPFLKAALVVLAERSPEAVAVGELVRSLSLREAGAPGELVPRLGKGLMLAYATRLVELFDHPPACAARPGERPVASPLARLQAARPSGPITTLHHLDARLTDPLARHVLARLDGTRDLEALARESAEVLAAKGLMRDGEGKVVTDAARVRAMVDEAIGAVLEGLARSALLTA